MESKQRPSKEYYEELEKDYPNTLFGKFNIPIEVGYQVMVFAHSIPEEISKGTLENDLQTIEALMRIAHTKEEGVVAGFILGQTIHECMDTRERLANQNPLKLLTLLVSMVGRNIALSEEINNKLR